MPGSWRNDRGYVARQEACIIGLATPTTVPRVTVESQHAGNFSNTLLSTLDDSG